MVEKPFDADRFVRASERYGDDRRQSGSLSEAAVLHPGRKEIRLSYDSALLVALGGLILLVVAFLAGMLFGGGPSSGGGAPPAETAAGDDGASGNGNS